MDTIYPFLASCFGEVLPDPRSLRVADAFVVKYNAAGGQTHLTPHRDGAVLSFNIALNDAGDYVTESARACSYILSQEVQKT